MMDLPRELDRIPDALRADHSLMTPEQIKNIRAVNWAGLARLIGVDRSAITNTLKGRRCNPRLRRAIALAAGFRAEDVWPDLKKAS